MAAFMMAFLLQTLLCIYAEHFDLRDRTAEAYYLLRIYMVTPQQFIYALVFSNQRAGSVVGHFLQFHTATIKSSATGTVLANVNTTVNKVILEANVKSGAKLPTVGTNSPKLPMSLAATKGMPMALSVDAVIDSKGYRSFKSIAPMGASKRLAQALLFVPVSFVVWAPIHFMQQNYSKKLALTFTGAAVYAGLMMFPFFFFQGTRDNSAEARFSTIVALTHVSVILGLCIAGVYNNRHTGELLVVDRPSPSVRMNLRNALAYLTLTIEFFQLPILAVSAAHLTTRYKPESSGSDNGLNELTFMDYTLQWTFDDLFNVQYPIAVTAVVCWAAIFSVAQAASIVYRRPMDSILKHVQVVIFVLSGPAYLFIVKTLMKPIFCIPDAGDGAVAGTLVVAAQKELLCWSDRHLSYCTFSLFGLCIFCPSATLTNAVREIYPKSDYRNANLLDAFASC
jgi:hypothetical protein